MRYMLQFVLSLCYFCFCTRIAQTWKRSLENHKGNAILKQNAYTFRQQTLTIRMLRSQKMNFTLKRQNNRKAARGMKRIRLSKNWTKTKKWRNKPNFSISIFLFVLNSASDSISWRKNYIQVYRYEANRQWLLREITQ